ncbi:histone H3-like centromeric protein A isoform X1 [Cavia porcellus]|uniref:histone H3-like centromeric protein A isoform X1 n=1 Tax=Cavia porcellus TaxID=10141 RepID=UPI000661B835|nr:histone H3-like centromeric protein A isoform X1 [Cavia porcellus]
MGPRRSRRKPETPRRRTESPSGETSRPRTSGRARRLRWLREIRELQKSTDLLLRKAPFSRVVREICAKFTRGVDFNWQAQALLALQEVSGGVASPFHKARSPRFFKEDPVLTSENASLLNVIAQFQGQYLGLQGHQ